MNWSDLQVSNGWSQLPKENGWQGLKQALSPITQPFQKYGNQALLAGQTLASVPLQKMGINYGPNQNLINKVQQSGMLSDTGEIGGKEVWNTTRNTADVMLKTYGISNPSLALKSSLGGAAISPLFQLGSNILNKEKLSENLLGSVSRGFVSGVANSGTTRLTNALVQGVSKIIPALKPLQEGNLKVLPASTLKEGIDNWLNVAGKRFIKSAVLETAIESPIWAGITQKEEEKYLKALTREVKENLVMNIGMAGISSLNDLKTLSPLIEETIKSTADDYFKKMSTPNALEKQRGWVDTMYKGAEKEIEKGNSFELFKKPIDSFKQLDEETIKEINNLNKIVEQTGTEHIPLRENHDIFNIFNNVFGKTKGTKALTPTEQIKALNQLVEYQKGVDIPHLGQKESTYTKGTDGKFTGRTKAETKLTAKEIQKYDSSLNYKEYLGPNGSTETYLTRLNPKDVNTYFELEKDLEFKTKTFETQKKEVFSKAMADPKSNWSKVYNSLEKTDREYRSIRSTLDNILKFGNDPIKTVEDISKTIQNPSKEFTSIMDKIKKFNVSENRKEIDITGGKVRGYFDNTIPMGKNKLTFNDVKKIEPKKNDEVVGELISSGWKGNLVNPHKRAFKTMVGKIYDIDVPIEEEAFFGNKAMSDSMYNKQINIATDPDNISAVKYAIDNEQKILKAKYPSGKITLYRGIGTKDLKDDDIFTSWTDDPKVAQRFGKKGTVIKKEIPVERVVLSYNTQKTLGKMGENMPDVVKSLMGGNAEQESEYIVINKPQSKTDIDIPHLKNVKSYNK